MALDVKVNFYVHNVLITFILQVTNKHVRTKDIVGYHINSNVVNFYLNELRLEKNWRF